MTLETKKAAVEMERSWRIQDDSVQIAKWHKEI